ncbi:hypothetical protein HELRODRAFT_173337 [Helobdella robusta]|uniref:C-type lectin domain-containing protein n=1 Tax=Helobdella robusta TaxID=6412 RepID=T1F6P5_HELRO|nr:hypothetical protein HELRODRAFT_173337 [Helobdella robusta]ESO03642.1 hypothetical protein HELRODRAFT_173337 [Helobdella robusta]
MNSFEALTTASLLISTYFLLTCKGSIIKETKYERIIFVKLELTNSSLQQLLLNSLSLKSNIFSLEQLTFDINLVYFLFKYSDEHLSSVLTNDSQIRTADKNLRSRLNYEYSLKCSLSNFNCCGFGYVAVENDSCVFFKFEDLANIRKVHPGIHSMFVYLRSTAATTPSPKTTTKPPQTTLTTNSPPKFYPINTPSTWATADSTCASAPYTGLPAIFSQNENTILKDFLYLNTDNTSCQKQYWTSGRRVSSSVHSAFKWNQPTRSSILGYTNWEPNMPTNTNLCLTIGRDYGYWQEEDCNANLCYVCAL